MSVAARRCTAHFRFKSPEDLSGVCSAVADACKAMRAHMFAERMDGIFEIVQLPPPPTLGVWGGEGAPVWVAGT